MCGSRRLVKKKPAGEAGSSCARKMHPRGISRKRVRSECRDRDDRPVQLDRAGHICADAVDAGTAESLFENGSPGWIRTTECLSQSQVPYRLATGL